MSKGLEKPLFTTVLRPHGSYLHRHTEEEGDQVHDGEPREQLSLQEHGGVVGHAVLGRGVVVVGHVDLVVHDDHVHHHAHNRHAEEQADQEGLLPPGREKSQWKHFSTTKK